MHDRSMTHYASVAQAFHWATALFVLIAYLYGPGGSEQRVYSVARDFDRQMHETLGLWVFPLVLLRVLWRMIDRRPDPLELPRWMDMAAKAVQAALYLLLFAIPISAVAGAWLEGHSLTLLAGVQIPSLLGT